MGKLYENCLVCEAEKEKNQFHACDECWVFLERARDKYPKDARGIEVEGFKDVNAFALYLKRNYYDIRKKKCFYTQLEMLLEEKGKKDKLEEEKKWKELNKYNEELLVKGFSVDRIDPTRNYVDGNIALCLNIINSMKYTLSHQEYIQACCLALQTEISEQKPNSSDAMEHIIKLHKKYSELPFVPHREEQYKVDGLPEKEEQEGRKKRF